MELWQLNILAVGLIALITRKDMAVYSALIMGIAWLAVIHHTASMKLALIFCALNCLLSMIAAAHYWKTKEKLSVYVGSLAAIATVVDFIQITDNTYTTTLITSILGWLLAVILLFKGGSRGLTDGFVYDFGASIRRVICDLSDTYNNKGGH